MKAFYRSKTLWANVIVIVLAYWFRWSSFYVDPMWFIWAIAVVNVLLRLESRAALRWRGV